MWTTSYVNPIQTDPNFTFEQYVWRCARAMGIFVDMRDDSLEIPTPTRIEPSTYHLDQSEEARKAVKDLQAMSLQDCTAAALEYYDDEVKARSRRKSKSSEELNRLKAMRVKVGDWTPPTSQHYRLKEFMLEQLDVVLKWAGPSALALPILLTGAEWRRKKIEHQLEQIEYHAAEHVKELDRVEAANAWLDALRASVPQPSVGTGK